MGVAQNRGPKWKPGTWKGLKPAVCPSRLMTQSHISQAVLLWMDRILHQFESMQNHNVCGIYRGFIRNQVFLGCALDGFRNPPCLTFGPVGLHLLRQQVDDHEDVPGLGTELVVVFPETNWKGHFFP